MDEFNCFLELAKQGVIARQYIYEVGGYRYNWHKEIEIMLVISGEVEVCVEGSIYDLEMNDIIVINSNIGHASLKKKNSSVVMVLHINPAYFDLFCDENEFIKFNCNSVNKDKNSFEFKIIRELLSHMMFSMLKNNILGSFESLGHLSLISSHLMQYFYEKTENNLNLVKYKKQQDRLKVVIDYIEERYREKICLDDIAKLINYNSSYASSFFKNYIGVNFYEYLLRVRLQSAIIELITTNKTIYNIALDNGFSDVKAFNASFKKNFNRSPNEYRVKGKKITPTLSLEERAFVNTDSDYIIKKLESYRNIDNFSKDDKQHDTKKYLEIESDASNNNEIKIICEKNENSNKFLEYLNNSNIKLKLEIL